MAGSAEEADSWLVEEEDGRAEGRRFLCAGPEEGEGGRRGAETEEGCLEAEGGREAAEGAQREAVGGLEGAESEQEGAHEEGRCWEVEEGEEEAGPMKNVSRREEGATFSAASKKSFECFTDSTYICIVT